MARSPTSQLRVSFLVDTKGLTTGFRRATAATDRYGRSTGQVDRSTGRLGTTLGRATVAAAGAAAAFVPLSLAISQAARSTIEFDRSMRNVNSIAQLGEGQFQGLSKSVLELAGPTAQAPRTLADGLYDLVSSGFQSREALQVLEVSAKAATAGLTTTEVASKTVAAALNAYRLPAKRASVISDILFRTVDRGVISFEQLSSDIGDVLPFASSLGVGLEEVGASIATMTKAGIGSAETMTRVKNVMVTLLKPGDDLSAAMKSVGFESGEAMIQSLGFQGTLDALIKTTDGSKNAVAQLFPNIRALGGALALTGQNSAQASEDLAGMREAAGATDRALSQQSESIYFQWQRLKATAEALAIEVGSKLVPSIREVLKVLSDDSLTIAERFSEVRKRVIDAIEDLAPEAAEAAGEVGVAIAKSMGKAFIETGLLGKVAITTLLYRSVGGIRGITAAGTVLGTTLGGGINQGLLRSAFSEGQDTFQTFSRGTRAVSKTKAAVAGLGVAAGTAAYAMKGLVTQVGLVGAAFLTIQAGVDAFRLFQPEAEGVQDRLAQIEAEGKTVQARMVSLIDTLKLDDLPVFGLVSAGSKALFGDLKNNQEQAKALREDLAEIGTADRGRFRTLRPVIAERIRELDLTREQRKEIEKIIAASKIGRQNAAGDAIDRMNRTIASGAFVGGDLERAVEQQLSRINDTYGRYTPRWRAQVEATFRAQIDATRRTYSEAGRLTEEGQRRIQDIVRRRARLMASGDPIGIARGIVNGWRRAGKVNDAGIRSFIGRLAKMPPAARKQAGATMIAYARELEQKGKLPDGTVKRLRSRLILRFGPELWRSIQTATAQGWKGVDKSFESGSKNAEGKLNRLERATREHARKVSRNISGINPPVRAAYSRLAGYANETAAAFGSNDRVKLSFRGGGQVPGRNLVPAAVSPGELISHKGREIYVPGRPEPRDSVLMFLPVGAKVFTRDGQMRLAAGSSESEALRKQAPHFAAGGMVGSDLPRPRLSGGPRVPRATGQAAIDRGRSQARAYIERLKPTLEGLERLAAKFGLQTTSGYRAGDDGYHGINRARDFSNSSGPTPEMLRFAKYVGGNFGRHLLELIYSPLGWSIKNGARTAPYAVADHYDHVHVAMRKGGKVRNINRLWPESNSAYGNWGGPTLPSYVVAALAQAAGMPGKTMEQVTRGESGSHSKNSARPGATGIDPGGTKGHGLWMITSGYNEDLAAKVGGWRNMLNPVVNAWAAAQIYRRQGLGAWYGTGSVTGDGLDYTGNLDLTKWLGGLGFQGALWVATNGRVGEKPKAITAIQKGAGRLLNRTDKRRDRFRSNKSGTPGSWKKLKQADRLAKRARALAKQGKVAQAQALMERANKLVAQATGQKPKSGGGAGSGSGGSGGGAGSGSGGSGGGGATAPTGPLPQSVDDILKTASGPNLSLDSQESILSNALSIAQGTEGTDDDLAVLNRQRTLQEKIKAQADRRLANVTKKLSQPKFSQKNLAAARQKRDKALKDKARIEKELRKPKLSDKRRKELEKQLRNANKRLREANAILRPYGQAIEAQNEAATASASAANEIASIDSDISEITSGGDDTGDTDTSAADLAQAMKELADAIAEQNRLQSSVQATSSREALRMLSDVISGQIVGKRTPVGQTPVGVRY